MRIPGIYRTTDNERIKEVSNIAGRKRLAVFAILLTAICLTVINVTFAYYQHQTATKENEFKFGTVDVAIVEEFPKPSGSYAKKTVQLQNTGSVDAYLRAMIVPALRTADGSLACNVDYSSIGIGHIRVTAEDGSKAYRLLLADDWQAGWEFSAANNVFYFRKKVSSNGITAPLLSGVERDAGNWDDLNIDVLADAVQAEGDTLRQFLQDRWGVSSIGPDGTLVW